MQKISILIISLLWVWSSVAQTASSVLASGNWYKLAVSESGMYKIGYPELQQMGMDPATINPSHLALYGQPNGMLPMENSANQPDDLSEIAIEVVGAMDGCFDPEDYILFYGQGPTQWEFEAFKSAFRPDINFYEQQSYYFLTEKEETGLRVESQASATGIPEYVTSSADAYYLYSPEVQNLIQSGQDWVGPALNGEQNELLLSVYLDNRDPDSSIWMEARMLARAFSKTTASILLNTEHLLDFSFQAVLNGHTTSYANARMGDVNFFHTGDDLQFVFSYPSATDTSMAWPDYMLLNYRRLLVMDKPSLCFRDKYSAQHNLVKYQLESGSQHISVWDVSQAMMPKFQALDWAHLSFQSIPSGIVKEFVAFDESQLPIPRLEGAVLNQNLHAAEVPHLLIVTHPLLRNQAVKLAAFHQQQDLMDVLTVDVEQVYNEFSAGRQDPVAIRNFIRHLYRKPGGRDYFNYVLLFGDGSYDPLDRIVNNTNLVPVLNSEESLNPINACFWDDFYVMMDEEEGGFQINSSIAPDLAIGRLPVATEEEASALVEKMIRYTTASQSQGAWKNTITLVGDDEDNNTHMQYADDIGALYEEQLPVPMERKIYFDDFQQVATPEGDRFPGATAAINKAFTDGSLIVHYAGHAGSEGWAFEEVLQTEQMGELENVNRLPLLLTIACDHNHIDNPEKAYPGEALVKNSHGGVIGVIGGCRPLFGSPSYALNELMIQSGMEQDDEGKIRLGDILLKAKQARYDLMAARYILLGDPALALALPDNRIELSHINGIPVKQFKDTLTTAEPFRLKGEILDFRNLPISTFNGSITIQLLEQRIQDSTLANDGGNAFVFSRQDSVLRTFVGEIVNGTFDLDVAMPAYSNLIAGQGRLLFYAANQQEEASGSFNGPMLLGTPAGWHERKKEDFVTVYPTLLDDSHNTVALEFGLVQNSMVQVGIYDALGRKVYSDFISDVQQGSRAQISVENLSKGMHLLMIDEGGRVQRCKLLVK